MLLGRVQVAPGGEELRPSRSFQVSGSPRLQNGSLSALEEAWNEFLLEAFSCQVWSFSSRPSFDERVVRLLGPLSAEEGSSRPSSFARKGFRSLSRHRSEPFPALRRVSECVGKKFWRGQASLFREFLGFSGSAFSFFIRRTETDFFVRMLCYFNL